ncbi:hypothetical protein CK203_044663 [Vitis vinifera]|uniref:Uncharacterized protein n=1 Tax=Vitis vinifera TaxID=29760 RepID=A0A438H999_VITVI|nr:hypothetical protein CK203_044663 [Vitis vinifera]
MDQYDSLWWCTRKHQLDQSIQSSKRSQLTYLLTLSHLPCSGPYRAYTRGSTLCSSGHTIDSPCYSPPTSEPSPSIEPRIAIPIIEYRGLCHTFQALATSQSILTQQMTALRAHQEQIIATQASTLPS